MNLVTLCEEIAENLDTISGLQVFPYVPLHVTPPTAFVGFPTVTYDLSASGGGEVDFHIFVLAGKADDRTAWRNLTPYMDDNGASSIRAAIEADPTFDGQLDGSRLTGASVIAMSVAAIDYLAIDLSLHGWWS